MKKILLSVTLIVCLIGFSACGGGGKYADVKAAMEDMLDAFEGLMNGVEKASDAKGVVAAINTFADKMKALTPKMKELEKKYPELKEMQGDKEKVPADLEDVMKKFEEVMPKMMGVMTKLGQYASDPEVQEAQKKLQEAMSGL